MNFSSIENGFKMESRLPISLFKAIPFIYTGPDFMSFPLGMISNIISLKNRNLQRFFPITISKIQGKTLLDQMFCFSFFYIIDEYNLGLYLTHPFWFNRLNLNESMDFFIRKIDEIAKDKMCNQILIEIHNEFTSSIAYPTSLSNLSYYLNKNHFQADDLELFKQYGYNEVNSLFCYEQSVETIIKNLKEDKNKIKKFEVKTITQRDFIKIKDIINDFPIRSFSLSNIDLIISHKLSPHFNRSMFILCNRSERSFNSSIIGFVQWVPNLFELFRIINSPIPYLFYQNFKDFPFNCGKIINWSIKQEKDELFIALIYHTMNMLKKRGIKKCQIGFVHNEYNFIKKILKNYNFSNLHTIKLLSKKVV